MAMSVLISRSTGGRSMVAELAQRVEICQLVELLPVLVVDAPFLFAFADDQAHETDSTVNDSTRLRTRAGKPTCTVASGAKVKVSQRRSERRG